MTLNIDIENINKIGNIHKNHKTPLRKIYEVIQQEFFEETDIFQEEFKNYKNNANESHNIQTDEKVVMICPKDLNITEKNRNKNEDKFKYQSQYARFKHRFDIDFDWIEKHFSTREPGLYNKIYKSHDETQDKNTFKMFVVPIGNVKNVEERSLTLMPQ